MKEVANIIMTIGAIVWFSPILLIAAVFVWALTETLLFS